MVNAPATCSGSPVATYAAISSSVTSAKCTVVDGGGRGDVAGRGVAQAVPGAAARRSGRASPASARVASSASSGLPSASPSSSSTESQPSTSAPSGRSSRAATAAHLSSASWSASSAGGSAPSWDSSTPETITTGLDAGARSVARRAGDWEARTSGGQRARGHGVTKRQGVAERADRPARSSGSLSSRCSGARIDEHHVEQHALGDEVAGPARRCQPVAQDRREDLRPCRARAARRDLGRRRRPRSRASSPCRRSRSREQLGVGEPQPGPVVLAVGVERAVGEHRLERRPGSGRRRASKTSRNRSSLVPKIRTTYGCETPASLATASVLVPA